MASEDVTTFLNSVQTLFWYDVLYLHHGSGRLKYRCAGVKDRRAFRRLLREPFDPYKVF